MAKPVKKGPSLPGFDSDDAPEPTRPFTERFIPPTPRPFAEQIRNAQPGLFGGIPLKEVVRDEPVAQPETTFAERVRPSGEKGKARDILAAIRTLHQVEQRGTPATAEEREVLERFGGFGPVALSIFPNPATGEYKDGWEEIGRELRELLTDEEYASAKRTTFNAFYTSPVVIDAMHAALQRLGVPENALVLEPGCGSGGFLAQAPQGMRFLGVELDRITGRIVKALYPYHDIRVQDFQDTKLPALDAVIGNVPFADVKLDHKGQKFSLHDYFFAKSVDSLKPGGVLALVTSHYTLDKQNAAIREYLADRADFLGAIRLPSDAFKREGTAVVTDIVFLRKRAPGQPENHADYEWKQSAPLAVDDTFVPVNRYFHNHPEMVLGDWTGKDTLYGEGYSIKSNGDLAAQLTEAVEKLPQFEPLQSTSQQPNPPPAAPPFVPPPPERHISEGSFFVHEGRIHQLVDGQAEPVVYGGGELWANGAMFGRRMGALIELRDLARRVLQSQNEGWPEGDRDKARLRLNRAYEFFTSAYGPINKTTFSENKDGTTIRRMPNLAKFREDPDAMLVMALEEYDEETGTAKKAPIMSRDVVGQTPPVTSVATAEEGLLVSLNQRGVVDLPYISQLYGKPEDAVVAELGDLIYQNPETRQWEPADQYLSGNVRAKLAAAEKAGVERNVEALKAVIPEDVLPGDIDANLGAPWIPATDIQAFAAHLFGVEPTSITVSHLAKDAVWSLEGDWSAERSVANTADYGTGRASGLWLLDLALNLKSPVIYDPMPGDPDKRQVNQEETLKAKEKQKAIKEAFRSWVFADHDRTERLVRLYNDAFNCLRPRQFDGSHLDFPGMSQAVTLRPHQNDVIWRCVSGGNTLIAHEVGSGKTYSSAAAAMKMRQTGLAKKILCCVPNHLLEQYAREFQHLYPNAKLLVATKEDLAKDRRKLLTAKIASGDWDAIIMTHSSFERIGMSKEFQERFLRAQIAEYDQLLADRAKESYSKARRNVLKVIEKQKAAREAKLKELLAGDKKDSGLVFDELGVDQVIVDECFAYDTLIDTDRGLLKIGDVVSKRLPVSLRTWNKSTGVIELKPIVNWFTNKRKGPLVEVIHESGSFICTPRHKIWVAGHGYKVAGSLVADEALLVLPPVVHHPMHTPQGMPSLPVCETDANGTMREVPGELYLCLTGAGPGSKAPAPILQQPMQGVGPAGQPGNRGQVQSLHAPPLGQLAMQGASESWGVGMDEGESVCLPTRNSTKNLSGTFTQKEPPCTALLWGQRQTASTPAIAPRGSDWNAHGVCNQDTANSWTDGQAAALLQGRPCRPVSHAGGGSGWVHPLLSQGKGAGREERQGPVASRVVRVAVLEPGSDGEYRFGGRTHQVVYDIEVADNHNYFANGVLVSNCQAYKNLETPTKMDRVAGIQTGGSERAFDLYMKAEYLHDLHPGHGLIGLSGTPISNSLVEMYTLQRFLDPDGLRDRGIDHFDAWAATFGEVVEAMEISPDGKTLKPRARFSKFINLPELQQMFRAFADVQTADMLNLPRPVLEGGKPHIVACAMSDEQHAIQQELVERYERIRNGGVDPREDNALAITTDGRKLALDARMLSREAHDFPESKVNAMVGNVAAIWERTKPAKSTQLVFCDFGVNPTPWGYCAYDEIVEKLAGKGIPREQIAVVGDADSDAKKQALFEKVRNGVVRVLIGSTSKMGTGTNVQKRLIALHHLDCTWKPAEIEQRDGRVLRQGNDNPEVAIYRYVTEGSFDAFMWQTLETKAKFINQIMTGESGVRRAEDVGGQELSFAEVKALASGRSEFLVLAETDAELQRLGVLRRSHLDEQYTSRVKLKDLPQAIERAGKRLASLEADAAAIAGGGDLIVGGRSIGHQDPALATALNRIPDQVDFRRQYPVGTFHGLTFGIDKHPGGAADVYLEGQAYRTAMLSSHGPRAVWNALNRLAASYGEVIEAVRKEREVAERQLADYQDRLGKPFRHGKYLDELTALRDQLKLALSDRPTEAEQGPSAAELSEKIKALRASHHVEAAPVKKVESRRSAPPKVEAKAEVIPPAEQPTTEPVVEEPSAFRQRVNRGGQQMSLF